MSKVIVITGASSGIGEETAKLLAKDGAKLVLGARREERLKDVASEVVALGGQAVYTVTDVTKYEDVEALAKLALATYGRIDVWISNAEVMPQAPFMSQTVKKWESAIDTNIKGVLYGISLALPQMKKQKSGQIITVASVEGHHAHVGGGVYLGTKYAVRAMA
ncbi:SDR family oxidoreductase [uncultured Streptococcus sp.]|uniref:SDR family oxidoreductase n=1 Tax=uncultured Streptococcus sp. TaxID=83427 RepID=UPI0027DBC1C9|nr:SDR family oxidoreductase [uncultured Streptococcus sp.]